MIEQNCSVIEILNENRTLNKTEVPTKKDMEENGFNRADMSENFSIKESAYKISMGTEMTNSNSYSILLMTIRNVIEKKMI